MIWGNSWGYLPTKADSHTLVTAEEIPLWENGLEADGPVHLWARIYLRMFPAAMSQREAARPSAQHGGAT